MKKQATGVSDLLDRMGMIPHDGRNYSWIDDGLKNTLIGGGIGAAALGGAGELFNDEEDPEKRHMNLKNNLLMGAGLGAGGGALWTGLRGMNNTVPTGTEPNGSFVRNMYATGRGMQHGLGDAGVGGVAGGAAAYLKNRSQTAAEKILGPLRGGKDTTVDKGFNPPGEELGLKQFGVPAKGEMSRFHNFLRSTTPIGGVNNPNVAKEVIDKLHMNNEELANTKFNPDEVSKGLADNTSRFYNDKDPLYNKSLDNANKQMSAGQISTKDFQDLQAAQLPGMLNRLKIEHLKSLRTQALSGAGNNPVLNQRGNIFGRIAANITGNVPSGIPVNPNGNTTPPSAPPLIGGGLGNWLQNQSNKLTQWGKNTLNPKAPVYQQRLTDFIGKGSDALAGANTQGALRQAGRFVPFSPYGKYSNGPIHSFARTALPAAAASWGVNQVAPYTTDKWFGGPELQNSLRERGIEGRENEYRQQYQQGTNK